MLFPTASLLCTCEQKNGAVMHLELTIAQYRVPSILSYFAKYSVLIVVTLLSCTRFPCCVVIEIVPKISQLDNITDIYELFEKEDGEHNVL